MRLLKLLILGVFISLGLVNKSNAKLNFEAKDFQKESADYVGCF